MVKVGSREALVRSIADDRRWYSIHNLRLERIEHGRRELPDDPFFVWAEIGELQWFVTGRDCDWLRAAEGRRRLDEALEHAFRIVREPEDRGGDYLALYRIAHLVSAARLLATTPMPTAQTLERVRAHVRAYERTREARYHDYEDNFVPGVLFRNARASAEAFALAAKESRTASDFLAIVALAEDRPAVIQGPLDPVLALSDFQEWARQEIRERTLARATSDPIEGELLDVEYVPIGTEGDRLLAGRVLMALLLGEDPVIIARSLIGADRGEPLRVLLATGLNPNAPTRQGDDERLLHEAVRRKAPQAVAALIAGGADPTRRNGKDETALELAADSPALRAVLERTEAGSAPFDISWLSAAATRS